MLLIPSSIGEDWQFHRRVLQPVFHMSTLETFVTSFSDASQMLVKRLKEAPCELNITHLVNQCVIEVLNGILKSQIFI